MSHVYVLNMTNDRVPRWFTEGLAVHEETAASPDWGDRLSPDIIAAIRDKKLLPVAEIDRGFMHPTYPAQVIVSYYQAGKICDYISERWGESKLLEMIHDFAKNRPTRRRHPESSSSMEPEEFDKEFLADARQAKPARPWPASTTGPSRCAKLEPACEGRQDRRSDRERHARSKTSIPTTWKPATSIPSSPTPA